MQLIKKKKLSVVIFFILIAVGTIFAEGARYLIITHDSFYSAIQHLKEWKHKKGMMTKVVKLSEISSIPNRDSIKNYIVNAYNTWNPRPEYVLLVGGMTRLPLGYWSMSYSSDNYYASMAGDFKAEISVGRLPCTTATQCSTMVNKNLSYERTPLMTDTNWFRRSTFIIRFDTPYDTVGNFVQDLRYIRDTCMVPDGFIVDSLFNLVGQSWHNQGPDSASDVINVLNEGRGFLVYRGHSECDWRIPFKGIPDSLRLSNGAMLPIILAGACQSIFEDPFTVGEKWLRVGTPQNLKGAVAYIGNTMIPTGTAFWRIYINRGLFKAICLEDSLTLGHALLKAKDSLYVNYQIHEDYYAECNLLGDPELNLWTAVPKPLAVTHDEYIPIGSQNFTVTVKDQNTQELIRNALVCVMMPEDENLYDYGYTDSLGTIIFNIEPKFADTLCVTVTARNYHPYEGTCRVVQFTSNSPQATGFNQSRHLARKPNSIHLQMVYHSNQRIYYSQSTDNGQNWNAPELIDFGHYPCIALGSDGISPWVFYFNRGSFQLSVRRPNGTWKTRVIFQGDENPMNEEWSVGPAMKLAICPSSTPREDLAYGVFTDYERIYFYAFDTTQNYCEMILDEYSFCLAPSISINPKDLLHVVWQRTDEERSRIYYITTLEGITPDMIRGGTPPRWSEIVRISTELPLWQTEPASNPSTEAYGDTVYTAWRGPNESGDSTKGDIWRRARWLQYPPYRWEDPRNKSETPDNESNYPVMSTDFVTVWQEQVNDTNWDIWVRFEYEPTSQSLFQTPKASTFPNIEGYWAFPVVVFHCNIIWTEQLKPTLYEVKFDRYDYSPSSQPPYYVVEIGDTNPSPYCIERDGYYQYGSYSVDYSNQGLKYQLPYLNPQYSYLLRAIIYRTGQNNWIEEFYTDSVLAATVLFEPNKPETIWFQIPQESYDNTEVLQEIERIVGSWALVADLRLYQFEVFEDSGGGGGQSAGSFSLQRPSLYQSFPNPFKFRANIRFQLPVQSKVSLMIYDITGRAVRNLINEVKEPGQHSIAWDGKDNSGRILSQGIYFYRLVTGRFTDCKRTILIK